MKLAILAAVAALSLGGAAAAKDLPEGGLTVDEVAGWLTDNGYQAKIETESDGSRSIKSSTDGRDFYIYMYDCKDGRCGSMQFSSGFATKGAFNAEKMDEWDRTNRWGRAYVDKVNDPWLDFDVDLSPGGTYEMLSDEFGIWRQMLTSFCTYIGWK